jgi:hypothetical protein
VKGSGERFREPWDLIGFGPADLMGAIIHVSFSSALPLRSHFLPTTTRYRHRNSHAADRIPDANILVARDGVNTLSLLEEPQS